MEYQKSILKIYELLVKHPLKEFIIEEIIKEAKVGRTSGFDAIKWLEKRNLIKIARAGKQKSVKLLINETSLNFKFFLDSFEIKNSSPNVLFEINLFLYLISNHAVYRNINSILLFGSAISSKKPNDIDLLIVCRNISNVQEPLKKIRKWVECICDFTINLHFTIQKNMKIHDIFQKLMIYNQSYSINLLKDMDKYSKLKAKYEEVVYDINSIMSNINYYKLIPQLFYREIINLAYCNCWLEGKINMSKEEAVKLFRSNYIDKIKNFDKLNNIDKFNILKKITNEIGQKIFV